MVQWSENPLELQIDTFESGRAFRLQSMNQTRQRVGEAKWIPAPFCIRTMQVAQVVYGGVPILRHEVGLTTGCVFIRLPIGCIALYLSSIHGWIGRFRAYQTGIGSQVMRDPPGQGTAVTPSHFEGSAQMRPHAEKP